MGKGRGNSSAVTTNQALKLHVKDLLKSNLFIEGMSYESNVSWSGGANINIVTYCLNHDKEIKLKYAYKGILKEYKVKIIETPSNLGKGSIKYFVCPVTAVRCKTLFCCYDSDMFKSRVAYNQRIYYFIQTIAKEYRTASRYNKIDEVTNDLICKIKHKNYKGKPTRRYQYLKKLIDKRAYLNDKKNEEFDRYLHKYLGLTYIG
jgi:hypothetical protein